MTIWVLAVVLLAALAALGYRQGAIRVGFSFVGILFGAALAVPLGTEPVLNAAAVTETELVSTNGPV